MSSSVAWFIPKSDFKLFEDSFALHLFFYDVYIIVFDCISEFFNFNLFEVHFTLHLLFLDI